MDFMTINFIYRRRWYETVSRLTTSAASTDPTAALFKAISHANVDHISEALQVLSIFSLQQDASVAAIKASIYIHNSCQVIICFMKVPFYYYYWKVLLNFMQPCLSELNGKLLFNS